MTLVDHALKARETEGRPIRVGIVGAGFMTQGLTNHICRSVPRVRVAAISNRNPNRARGRKLSAGAASKLLDLFLNPKSTVQMVLRRVRLNRALKGAAEKDKRRGLKTHATVCR